MEARVPPTSDAWRECTQKLQRIGGHRTWKLRALPLSICVTSDKLLNLSAPLFPHCKMEIITEPKPKSWGCADKQILHLKHLVQGLHMAGAQYWLTLYDFSVPAYDL